MENALNESKSLQREFELLLHDHPTDERLEAYAMGRFDARSDNAELERIETHLLVCEDCQDAVAEIDEFVGAMRRTQESEPKRWNWNRLTNLFSFPAAMTWVPVAAVLMLSLGLLLPYLAQRAATTHIATVVYEDAAQRALPEARVAPAGQEFNLDLPAPSGVAGSIRIDVVSSAGRIEAQVGSLADSGRLRTHVSRKLSDGGYWVRLYSSDGNQAAEYELTIR